MDPEKKREVRERERFRGQTARVESYLQLARSKSSSDSKAVVVSGSLASDDRSEGPAGRTRKSSMRLDGSGDSSGLLLGRLVEPSLYSNLPVLVEVDVG